MNTTMEPWWNLRQALIWIATRDIGWVEHARSKYGSGGREVQGDSFDGIWADAYTSRDTLSAHTKPEVAKAELLAKIADGTLAAAQDGASIPASEFAGATVSDEDFLGTHIRRIETVQIGQLRRGDAVIYRPRLIAEQLRRLFPGVGDVPSGPPSRAELLMLEALEGGKATKRPLADEYDAAQDRGEVRSNGERSFSAPEKLSPTEIGLTGKEIHEARQVRDAEVGTPVSVPLTDASYNLYLAIVGEYGENGGFGTTAESRAGPVHAWSLKNQSKARLPKDAAREIRRMDRDIFAARQNGHNVLVLLKKNRQKPR